MVGVYREERERAGITRETTIQSLLFIARVTGAMIDFIQETRVATRRWLLRGVRENDEKVTWGWGSLQEVQERDGEEIASFRTFFSTFAYSLILLYLFLGWETLYFISLKCSFSFYSILIVD